jgi:hypothetical protein
MRKRYSKKHVEDENEGSEICMKGTRRAVIYYKEVISEVGVASWDNIASEKFSTAKILLR